MFNYFHKNELVPKCQSGFLPGDSCVSQLLSIVHDINSPFDCDPTQDAKSVFLDISKAFDKVWDEGLLYKLETYGVRGVLNLPRNYLHESNYRVVLNVQISFWEMIKSGVPQGSVLGPLISLIYISTIYRTIFYLFVKFLLMTHLYFHKFLINSHYRVNWIRTFRL